MIILLIILYLILFIILLTLFLLSIPYKYLFNYSYTENLNFKMAVQTFFFSFIYSKQNQKESTYIKIFSFKKEIEKMSSKKEPKEEKIKEKIKKAVKKKAKKEKKEKKKKKKSGIPFSIIRYENIKHIFELIIDLLKMILPKHLRLYFLIGLEEPHLNGWLIASYHSLKGIYSKLPITLDIDWEKETYESNGELSGYIIPIQLVFRLLIFIFSLKTIKILWQVFKYKRSK